MSTKNTPQPGQFDLPESLYLKAFQDASIVSNPVLLAILRTLHREKLTTGLLKASLVELTKPPKKKRDPIDSELPKEISAFYGEFLKGEKLIASAALIRIVAHRHMEILTANLAVSAYVEFRNRFPQGCDNTQEGESS